MKKQVVLEDGIYQVWSGSKNINKGVFTLTITGIAVGDYHSLHAAIGDIEEHKRHKRMVAIHMVLATHTGTPEDMAWLRDFITGHKESGHRDPQQGEKQ